MVDRPQPARSAQPAEPAPGVSVPAVVRVAAGARAALEVVVTNTAASPRQHTVLAVGVDSAWLPAPIRTRALGPGESATVSLELSPAAGTLQAQYPLVVTVQSLVPGTVAGQERAAEAPSGMGETVLVVNPRAQLSLTVDPVQATMRRSRKLRLALRNGGASDVDVELAATTTRGLQLRLGQSTVEVPAGGEVRLRGRLVAARPRRVGAVQQHSWTVTAAAAEVVRQARGSVRQRALLGPAFIRGVAVFAVVAVWIAAAVLFIPQLADRFGGPDDEGVTTATIDGNGDGDGAGEGSGGGSGGEGGSGGSGGVTVTRAESSAAPKGVQLNGSVTADDPGGVRVALTPTSLVDQDVTDALQAGVEVGLASSGKTPMSSLLLRVPGVTAPDRTATTTSDGTWSFPRVRAPGYYLLTFSKPGYGTQKFVVDAANTDATEPMEVDLTPGDGSLSGRVAGPNGGPVGGATVTISDGSSTLTTSSSSRGDRGAWSVTGLSTPGTYLVQVSSSGHGTESRLVHLGAGDSARADIALQVGVSSLVGRVRGGTAGDSGGLGGISVSVSDGKGTVRTATTVTGDQAGFYNVPGLPAPGSYTVTLSGDGFQTQTSELTVKKGQSKATLNADLVASTGVVAGVVRVTGPGSAGLSPRGAGLVLSNAIHTYKTTATSQVDGAFRINGVEPGVYQLVTQLYGFTADVLTVRVTAGGVANVRPRIEVLADGVLPATAYIRGAVVDAGTGGLVRCPTGGSCLTAAVTVDKDDDPATAVPYSIDFAPDEEYTVPDVTGGVGLEPGLHAVTISAPGYESATIHVELPLGATVVAPTVELLPAPVITGQITSAAGIPQGTTCVWAVPDGEDPASVGRCQDAVTAATCVDDEVTYDATAPGIQCAAVAGLGSYRIEVPKRGDYTMVVKTVDTDFQPSTPTRINAPPGSTVVHNVQLNRLGQIVLTVLEAGTTGALVASANATVTLEPGSRTETSNASGGVRFTGLPPGTYTMTAAKGARQAAPFQLSVSLNQEAKQVVALVETVSSVVGRVTTNDAGTPTSVSGADVTLTAPSGYVDTSPINGTVSFVTDPDGCFAVVANGSTAPAAGVCDSTYSPGAIRTFNFVSRTASEVQVSKPGYETLLVTNRALSTGLNDFSLEPSSVAFSGTMTALGAPGAVPWDQVSFRVDSTTTSTSGISVRAGADGVLTWNDTRYGQSDRIRPGSYTVTASLPGFASDSRSLTCLVATDCTLAGLQLRAFGSLTVRAVTGAADTEVDNAIVTLSKSGSVVATRTAPTDGNTVTFPDLVPGATDYTVRVQAPGYDFDAVALACRPSTEPTASPQSSVTITAGAETVCGASLTRLASLTGTLTGVLAQSPATTPTRLLASAEVTAAPCTGTATTAGGTTYCTGVDASRTLRTTTRADGSFTLSGTSSIEGITTGHWLVAPSLPGWSPAPAGSGVPGTAPPGVPVAVTSTADVSRDLRLYVDPVDFTVRVVDQYGVRVASATVELFRGSTSVATATGTGSGSTAEFLFDNAIPGLYTLQVSGSGLVTSTTQVEIRAGVAEQDFQIYVGRGANSVQGTVTGDDAPSGLGDATVMLVTCPSGTCGTTPATGTDGNPLEVVTGGDGRFVMRTVPDGTFALRVTRRGYVPVTGAALVFNHTQAAVPALVATLTHVSRNVTVTVDTSRPTDDLTGATVDLTPVPSSSNTDVSPQTIGSGTGGGSVTYNQLRFGCWDISVTLPAGHYGDVVLPTRTTNAELSCAGHVVVPPNSGSSTITRTVAVNENELKISVAAVPRAGRSGPTSVRVRVPGIGYDNGSFAVTTGTTSLWVAPGSYQVTSDVTAGFSSTFWPQASASVNLTGGAATAALTMTERTSALTVNVAGTGAAGQATVTVAAGAGQDATVPAAYATGVPTSGGSVVLNLPSGAWTITATSPAGTSDTDGVTLDQLTESVALAPPAPPPPVPRLG